MHKLKKRRPSGADSQRPGGPSYPNDTHAATRVNRVPLELNDVAIARGDFRGSTIIAGLSNRFSVLKSPEPGTDMGRVPPLPSGSFTLEEMRRRFAEQRSDKYARDYMTEEEEDAFLADLEDSIRRQQRSEQENPLPSKGSNVAASTSNPSDSSLSSGRAYGFGSADAMREAEVMRVAKEGVRHRQQDSHLVARDQITMIPSGVPDDRGPALMQWKDPLTRSMPTRDRAEDGSGNDSHRRKSLLETMSPAAQQRISRAILQVEADMLGLTKPRLPDQTAYPIETASQRLPVRTPTKKIGSDRRTASMSRSPAFHDGLADVGTGQSTLEAATESYRSVHSARDSDHDTSAPRDRPASDNDDADVFAPKAGAAAHRPPPLALGRPLPISQSTLADRSGREGGDRRLDGIGSAETRLSSHGRADRADAPISAASKSSLITDGTGSYVAETPPETAVCRQQALAVPLQDPLPSPQGSTFDITGYYGDNTEPDDVHDVHGMAYPSTTSEYFRNKASSPDRSQYSSDYQSSPGEPSFHPALGHGQRGSQARMDDVQRDHEAVLGVSRGDLSHIQDQLIDSARTRQVGSRESLEQREEALPEHRAVSSIAPEANWMYQAEPDRPAHTSEVPRADMKALPTHGPVDLETPQEGRNTRSPFESVDPGILSSPDHDKHRSEEPVMSAANSYTSSSPKRSEVPTGPVEPNDREGAKSRLAQALFGPTEGFGGPPSPVGPTHSHRRLESTSSARSYRIDEDPDIRRDFEARIAQATAALHKTPSVRLSRKNTRNKAIKIGSPTLLQTSATLQVSPLTSPHLAQGAFSPTGNSLVRDMQRSNQGHGKSASVSSLANVEPAASSPKANGTTATGLKGLLAKITRKPSQKRAPKSSSLPATSLPQPSNASRSEPPVEVMADPRKARRSVVRRTLVVPTNITLPPAAISSSTQAAAPQNAMSTERKPSVKRKPVHRTSKDVALEQELMAPPMLQREISLRSRPSRDSGRDSLFELYGGHDEQTQPLGRYPTGDRPASLAKPVQMLEIREMSDGEVTYGLVDGVEGTTSGDATPRRQSQRVTSKYEDSLFEQSSASSYRKLSTTSNNFDLDEEDAAWSVAERELIESPVERPKTKVFYSSSHNLQELLADLSTQNADGHFRILPQNTPEEHTKERISSGDKHYARPGQDLDSRLQALVQKLQATR